MQKPSKICTKTSLLYNNLYIQNTISPHSLLPLARRNAAPPFTPSPYSQNRSPCTSKQGQALSHSSGSTTPFPLRSGLRSRCPVTRHPGKSCSNTRTSTLSEWRCCGVRVSAGPSVGIQSPFVAHPDARSVETPGMCTRPLHRTHRANQAVPAHIIMIAAPVESPAAVLPFQVLRRERHPRRRSRAVHHNQVHLPHSAPPFREEPFEPLKMQNTHFNNRMIIHFIPIRNKH